MWLYRIQDGNTGAKPMSKVSLKPWHSAVSLRPDIRNDELTMAEFAADLQDAAIGRGPKVYRDPREFFALTYPTHSLKRLAADVMQRLSGENPKAVRQLKLTYGGGKTHTLIALMHLARDPDALPDDVPAVREFIEHAGGATPPKARIAVLPFDKIDVEKGMETFAPDGSARWLKHPWSILAWEIAGPAGLRLLHAEDLDEERESPPAENLLTALLAMPQHEGLGTLVLIDEVLMFAREKVGLDAAWRDRLVDFFQYLTQAAVKVERCAVVASLLATDPKKSDELGKEIIHELYTIFRRQREEEVEPVEKADVAEVLRRRFFTPDSIRNTDAFRPHVAGALAGITALDDQTQRDGKDAERAYLASFPFHPELTEVFYGKWTNLEGFQRTRGILRTFALALRDAEKWDTSPLIGVSAFLSAPGVDGLSTAASELTNVASAEETEGKRQEWGAILAGELAKARQIQTELVGLRHREIEGVVMGTFLHSQPIGHEARTRDLVLLVGATRPDQIDLEKGLRRWVELSWYLDEAIMAVRGPDGSTREPRKLPEVWKLGTRPNLKQMHHDARERVNSEITEARLLDEVQRLKWLTAGAQGAGAAVHMLPRSPRDVEDDGEFHFVVLGPRFAAESGKPGTEAARFLDETTGPDRPRVHRNSVVCVAPSRDGLELARERARDLIAWEEVQNRLREINKGEPVDPIRAANLRAYTDAAASQVPAAIKQAWSIVVTVSDKDEVHAFKLPPGDDNLFINVVKDSRSRVQEQAVSAEALLPHGPYDLWKPGDSARRFRDVVGAFSTVAKLPKMLNRRAIADTIVRGCADGTFVLRTKRPDGTFRTWWREETDQTALTDPSLEIVLPGNAELSQLASRLLQPRVLPSLWQGDAVSFEAVGRYFSGTNTVQVSRDSYSESISIPAVLRGALEFAVKSAVAAGDLWLVSGPASLWREEVPHGILGDGSILRAPPSPIGAPEVLPESLAEAWSSGETTALALASALSQRTGLILPWSNVRDGIDAAIRARYLETTPDSSPWPSDIASAKAVRLRVRKEPVGVSPRLTPTSGEALRGEAILDAASIQDLADIVSDLLRETAGFQMDFRVRVEVHGQPSSLVLDRVNGILAKSLPALTLR
jgi:hypothetical protein